MHLYVTETPLLAARLSRALNLSRPESTVFCTGGPMLAADLRPLREALIGKRSPFIRKFEFRPRGNAVIQLKLKQLNTLASQAKKIFWVSYPSPESELHYRHLIAYLRCAPCSVRVLCASAHPSAIRHAILHPAYARQTLPLYRAAYCRMVADAWMGYIVSYEVSRSFKSYQTNDPEQSNVGKDAGNSLVSSSGISLCEAHSCALNSFQQITAGRLQWPVLKWIHDRISQKTTARIQQFRTDTGKWITVFNADKLHAIKGVRFNVLKIIKSGPPPLLYTGDELLRDLICRYGIGHQSALAQMEELFEHGNISWPHTTIPFLAQPGEDEYVAKIKQWSAESGQPYKEISDTGAGSHLFRLSAKAAEHGITAIFPPSKQQLHTVYQIIARRCLVAFTGQRSGITESMVFQAVGMADYLYADISLFDQWKEGMTFSGQLRQDGLSNAPKRGEVLAMMASAGEGSGQAELWTGQVENVTGLGRVPNRNRIIDQLISNNYLRETDGKLVLTTAGEALVSAFGNSPLMDINSACAVESKIRQIREGNLEPAKFLDYWQKELTTQISMLTLSPVNVFPGRSGGGGYHNKAACIRQITETPCPQCRKYGTEVNDDGVRHRECGLYIARMQFGKRLSWNQLRLLCIRGSTHILNGFNVKDGRKRKGNVHLNEQASTEFRAC